MDFRMNVPIRFYRQTWKVQYKGKSSVVDYRNDYEDDDQAAHKVGTGKGLWQR